MKRKLLLFLLVVPTLISCKSPYSITVEKDNSLTSFVSQSFGEIDSRIASNSEFAVLFSNRNACGSCKTAEENVASYANETKKVIYQYTYEISSDPLKSKYPNLFDMSYPALFLISKGQCIYSFDSFLLQEKSQFAKMANQHIF